MNYFQAPFLLVKLLIIVSLLTLISVSQAIELYIDGPVNLSGNIGSVHVLDHLENVSPSPVIGHLENSSPTYFWVLKKDPAPDLLINTEIYP